MGGGGRLESMDAGVEIAVASGRVLELRGHELEIALGLLMHLIFEVLALMVVVQGFDGLFEADGDEEADADGGDVDEEVAPGVDGFVGSVDVEHGRVLWGGEVLNGCSG